MRLLRSTGNDEVEVVHLVSEISIVQDIERILHTHGYTLDDSEAMRNDFRFLRAVRIRADKTSAKFFDLTITGTILFLFGALAIGIREYFNL